MYEVNLLDNELMEWTPLCFNGHPMVFSSRATLMHALKNNLGKSQQIIYDNHFMVVLDGTEHNIEWFKRNHDKLVNKLKYLYPTYDNEGVVDYKVKKLGGRR